MTDLFDSTGRRIPLGKKLGAGGEGTVYDVPALGAGMVAKVYHETLHPDKQAKLRGMVKVVDESLKKFAAWPLDTLHTTSGGPMRGFLMQKVTGFEPIHHLYGPSHRKQRFPDKDWAFLVNTARNTAAAFDAIHSHGHVIGDVNPNLVFVGGKSLTKLIYCDSFQIFAAGKHYLCEVGVPHFTPPELQRYSTFRDLRRSKNHDNFGLALLIFHILLMGRHPFSGVYSGHGDMPLEKAIAQFRYAYGCNSVSKGMTPPPKSVTPAILSAEIIDYFDRAFAEQGAQPVGRPTARDWIAALDALREQLRTCDQEATHKYFGDLPNCPWCAQEQRSGSYFFIPNISSMAGLSNFNLGKVWAKIMSITPPGVAPEINTSGFQVQPTPLPVKSQKGVKALKIIAVVGLIIGILTFIPAKWYLTLMGSTYFMLMLGAAYTVLTSDSPEWLPRHEALRAAQRDFAAVQDLWRRETGDARFQEKINELSRLRAEYLGLTKNLALERQALQQKLYNAQLHKFLAGFPVAACGVIGVGPAQISTLALLGVKTAANINWNTVTNTKGLEPSLKSGLVAWRTSMEHTFVFDPANAVAAADLANLNQRFAMKKRQLEGSLLASPELLNQLRGQILQQRDQMLPMMHSLAQRLAQTEADISVFG